MNRADAVPAATRASRAHHYVPVFYLAGFTLSSDRQDVLWVRDRQQDKCWQSRPVNIAHQRDFYRVDIDGLDPDAVEKALAEFEGQAADLFRNIAEKRQLPEGEEFDLLLNFVALQATRVPYHRQWYEDQAAHLAKWRARVALGHPSLFERFLDDLRRQGEDVPDFITREGMVEFLEDESRYTIEIPQEASIHHMAEMAKTLLPVLDERSWSLFVAKEDRDDFVCSDRPVILVPTRRDAPPFLGFGMKYTEVIMPLNRQMSLVGRYDVEAQVFEADRILVGLFNQRMLDYSERFIYSARDSFPVTVPRPRATS
jgi:hypothetical protein